MKLKTYIVVCHIPSQSTSTSYTVLGISKFTVKIIERISLRKNGFRLISVTKA